MDPIVRLLEDIALNSGELALHHRSVHADREEEEDEEDIQVGEGLYDEPSDGDGRPFGCGDSPKDDVARHLSPFRLM